MQIYYAKNDTQIGPIDIVDLTPNEISKETLVWHEGLVDWIPAQDVEILSNYFSATPPPLKKKTNKVLNQEKKYEKRTDAIGFGILLILCRVLFVFILRDVEKAEMMLIYGFIFLIFWSLSIRMVYKIAKEQNRKTDGWLFYVFFFPSMALITIGLLDKKPRKSS